MLEHVRSGVRIIQQHQAGLLYEGKTMIPLQEFIPGFARLERQYHEITGDPHTLILSLATEQVAAGFFEYSHADPQPVPHFPTLNHAWISLHQRWHALITWLCGVHQDWFNHLGDVHLDTYIHRSPKPPLDIYNVELRRDFELWSLGLEDLRKRLNHMTPKEEAIYALLKCHVFLADSILGTASWPRGLLWDDYRDKFQEIVALCRTVIEHEVLDSGAPTNVKSTPIVIKQRYAPDNEHYVPVSLQDARCPLTFDMSVCMVLCHVISKCRDARIRLDAIKLLEDYPRLEGLWDGAIVAQVGRAIDRVERRGANLEEAAAKGASAAEIPLSQRVLAVRGVPNAHTRSGDLLMYKAKGNGGIDDTPMTSVLCW